MALFAKILGALKGAPRSAGAQKQQIVVKVRLHKVLRGANLTRVDLNSLLYSEKLGKFRAQKFSLTINRVVYVRLWLNCLEILCAAIPYSAAWIKVM